MPGQDLGVTSLRQSLLRRTVECVWHQDIGVAAHGHGPVEDAGGQSDPARATQGVAADRNALRGIGEVGQMGGARGHHIDLGGTDTSGPIEPHQVSPDGPGRHGPDRHIPVGRQCQSHPARWWDPEFIGQQTGGLGDVVGHRGGAQLDAGASGTVDVGEQRTGRVAADTVDQGVDGVHPLSLAGCVTVSRVEAVLLVGGQGTRLRPLTITTPKPLLPVAGVTCTEHQIARAREAGVTRVILGTSYRADVFTSMFGDGSDLGVELIYAVEDEPLGTGGAIRNVAQHLRSGPDDPVLVFNGDVLTGVDIGRLVGQWRASAADVALYLTRVEDPRAYGLVPTDEDGRVLDFLEKPTTPEQIVTDQINAGCYVFRRRLIDDIPEGRVVSVERETFPELLAQQRHVIGIVDPGYWLDLGTPLSFVRGSCDLVRGIAPTPVLPGPPGEALVLPGARIASSAFVAGGSTIGRDAVIGPDAVIDGSIIMDGAVVEAGAVVRGSVVGAGAVIGAQASLTGAVIADRAHVGARNELTLGARVWPDTVIPPLAVRFSSDT